MHPKIAEALEQDAEKLDELYFGSGDALDAKASFVLVILTLLAAISGQVVVIHELTQTIETLQALAIVAIIVGVVMSILALWPRHFNILPGRQAWDEFLNGLKAEKKNITDEEQFNEFVDSRRRVTLARLATNKKIVEKKAKFNNVAFYATAAAILTQVLTLIDLAATRF